MTRLDAVRRRAPHLAVAWTTASGLALVAPLEHAAGVALGLGDLHAWTVTATIEGAAGAALVAGRHVAAALTLTGCSVLVGAVWSAHHAHPLTGPTDPRILLAVAVTTLAVSGMALAHRVRARLLEQWARQARQDAEASRRARAADDERARQAHEQVRADADAARRHEVEVERQRRWADDAAARTALDLERVRLDAAREQRAGAAPGRAPDALAQRRAWTEWERREGTDAPMTGAELATLLGCSQGHARKIAQQRRAARERAEASAR